MAVEIELKAWIADPQALMEKIDTFAQTLGSYVKEDAYWRPGAVSHSADLRGAGSPNPEGLGSGVRIRRAAWDTDDPQWVVNFKRKEVQDGVEVNDEREFAVSDINAFEELLERLGLRMWIRKRKSGRAWNFEDMTIEVSEVAGLGWFAELEIIAENNSEATVDAAREKLLDMLVRLEIPKESIEDRYYTEMLAALAHIPLP
jgi:adenylate cyclase class 2